MRQRALQSRDPLFLHVLQSVNVPILHLTSKTINVAYSSVCLLRSCFYWGQPHAISVFINWLFPPNLRGVSANRQLGFFRLCEDCRQLDRGRNSSQCLCGGCTSSAGTCLVVVAGDPCQAALLGLDGVRWRAGDSLRHVHRCWTGFFSRVGIKPGERGEAEIICILIWCVISLVSRHPVSADFLCL